MAKKMLEVIKCENCDANVASYRAKSEGTEDKLLCSPCQEAYKDGQEHPDAVIEPLGQEEGIDEDMFEDEGDPAKDDDEAGDEED